MVHNPATRRILPAVSNFQNLTRLLLAQHTVFSLKHLDEPSLTEGGVLLGLLNGRFEGLRPSSPSRKHLATDFSTIRGACSVALLCAFLPQFELNHVAVCLSLLYSTAPTTRGALQMSFVCSQTDRPSKTICSKLPADFQTCCVQSLPIQSYDLHTMKPTGSALKPKCHGRFSLTARLLAVHLQRLGWPLVLATIFDVFLQLCSLTCRLPPNGRTRTPHSDKTPPVGV